MLSLDRCWPTKLRTRASFVWRALLVEQCTSTTTVFPLWSTHIQRWPGWAKQKSSSKRRWETGLWIIMCTEVTRGCCCVRWTDSPFCLLGRPVQSWKVPLRSQQQSQNECRHRWPGEDPRSQGDRQDDGSSHPGNCKSHLSLISQTKNNELLFFIRHCLLKAIVGFKH